MGDLFVLLTTCVGVASLASMSVAVLAYVEPFYARMDAIRSEQDLAVSAQLNALHETIQELQRQRNQYRREYSALVTNTRMNDSNVTKKVN